MLPGAPWGSGRGWRGPRACRSVGGHIISPSWGHIISAGKKGGIVGLFVICYRRTKRGQFGVDHAGQGQGAFLRSLRSLRRAFLLPRLFRRKKVNSFSHYSLLTKERARCGFHSCSGSSLIGRGRLVTGGSCYITCCRGGYRPKSAISAVFRTLRSVDVRPRLGLRSCRGLGVLPAAERILAPIWVPSGQ